jgi:hypothetical protein
MLIGLYKNEYIPPGALDQVEIWNVADEMHDDPACFGR